MITGILLTSHNSHAASFWYSLFEGSGARRIGAHALSLRAAMVRK
jgi:hypothetical protein